LGSFLFVASGGSRKGAIGPCPPTNPAMTPIQSDSLAINFEFDIIRKNAYTVVN